MSTPLKFEFDFEEVFEGIKQGVIRELEEMNFDAAKIGRASCRERV